jgi:hypothetical protein
MTAALELSVNQANTERFIDLDPTWITLIPSVEVWSGGSKRWVDGVPKAIQKFKFIWPGGDQVVTTSDGTTKKLDFVLVGLYNSSISVGDYWKEGTQTYRIEEVEPFNGYQVKAKGIFIGGTPAHG